MILVEQTNALKSRLRKADLENFIENKRRRRIETLKNAEKAPSLETFAQLDVYTFDSRFVASHPEELYLWNWSKSLRLLSQLVQDAKHLTRSTT
jgi:hypothetical protein